MQLYTRKCKVYITFTWFHSIYCTRSETCISFSLPVPIHSFCDCHHPSGDNLTHIFGVYRNSILCVCGAVCCNTSPGFYCELNWMDSLSTCQSYCEKHRSVRASVRECTYISCVSVYFTQSVCNQKAKKRRCCNFFSRLFFWFDLRIGVICSTTRITVVSAEWIVVLDFMWNHWLLSIKWFALTDERAHAFQTHQH